MLNIYKTNNGQVLEVDTIQENTWIALTAPTEEELKQAAKECQIDVDDLRASLDVEEAEKIRDVFCSYYFEGKYDSYRLY